MSEEFRDKLSTVDEHGKRVWVYPKRPSGKFYDKRKLVSYLLLAFLFAAPHIRIFGEPLLLFNIIERKFVIFGQIFWPQDFHLFLFAMLAGVVFIVLFTVIFGRIFCGWICPQTIFLEMVFRRIERLIEGDYKAQKKLNNSKMTKQKLFKKTLKHIVFFGISFLVANTFLAYVIGSEELVEIQLDHPANHIDGLIVIFAFSLVFYGVFAFFREQVCTTVCPYGRFQGVMLDKNSIVVAYDYIRGEPREKNVRKREEKSGDCIDCKQCVLVCPTGIDIRNGTQLECVNCTACIDACNDIMHKVDKEPNLIKYASEAQIADNEPFVYTSRMKAYTALLVVLVGVFIAMLMLRGEVETSVLRAKGRTYQEMPDGSISNLYKYKIVNKTSDTIRVHFNIEEIEAHIDVIGERDTISLLPQAKIDGILHVKIKQENLNKRRQNLIFKVMNGSMKLEEIESAFFAPRKKKKQ